MKLREVTAGHFRTKTMRKRVKGAIRTLRRHEKRTERSQSKNYLKGLKKQYNAFIRKSGK